MRRTLRRLLFSLVPAVVLLGGLELLLRLVDLQGPADEDLAATQGMFDGAWVQRRDRHLGPAFVAGVTPDWRETSPGWRARGMNPERFSAQPLGETRLFALGGSTTAGLPFEHLEKGFPERLERVLGQRQPDRRWRVINAGVPGMDSRGFPDLAREAIDHGAHGLVIYAGNNEIMGTLIDECTNPLRQGLERDLNQLALFRFGRGLYRRLRPPDPQDLAALRRDQAHCTRGVVDRSRATHPQPPADHRTDPLYATTVDSFGDNLDRVLGQTRKAGVPVWLALPPVNLRHPPTLGLPAATLPDTQVRELEALLREGKAARNQDQPAAAVAHLQAAVAIDPSHARVQYELGMALLESDDADAAIPHLERAVDLDWEGTRVTSQLRAVVAQRCAADPAAARCVDLDAAFRALAPQGAPGDTLFVDFCHPTFELGVDTVTTGFADPIQGWAGG